MNFNFWLFIKSFWEMKCNYFRSYSLRGFYETALHRIYFFIDKILKLLTDHRHFMSMWKFTLKYNIDFDCI